MREGLIRAKKDGKYGFIDTTGEVVIPFVYDYVFDFEEGLAQVTIDAKMGVVDKTGAVVIPIEYESVNRSEGFGLEWIGNQYWIINTDGQTFEVIY